MLICSHQEIVTSGLLPSPTWPSSSPVEVSDEAMSLEEIERLLVRAIRSGSLQAVKLWLALHPNDGATPADDPFSEFDPVDAR